MREIKFRAWDKEKRVFKYPELWDNRLPSNWEQFYELQQFTGLYDKDGKSIYEGDIMPTKFGNRTIFWNEQTAAFCYTQPVQNATFEMDFYLFNLDSIVIGNIYENPELLNS